MALLLPVIVLLALACITAAPARAADAALIEAAKKEGKVVWYTTLIVNQAIRPLKEAFEKAYPGIELQYARADEAPTAPRQDSPRGAGRPRAGRHLRWHLQHGPAQARGPCCAAWIAVRRENPDRPEGPGGLLDLDPPLCVFARYQ